MQHFAGSWRAVVRFVAELTRPSRMAAWVVTASLGVLFAPSVAAAQVSAEGPLRDLGGQYINGSQTYDFSWCTDLSDAYHFELEEVGVGVVTEGWIAPFAAKGRFDSAARSFSGCSVSLPGWVDTYSLPEGAHTYRARMDAYGYGEQFVSDPWTVTIDRSAPLTPLAISQGAFSPSTNQTRVEWEPAVDPDLADGSPGSGVAVTEARYSINGGGYTAWTATNADHIDLVSDAGDVIGIQVRATDEVGNLSTVASASVTIKLDSTNPTIDPSGAFIENLGDDFGAEDNYDLWVDSADPTASGQWTSGVSRTRFKVDGTTLEEWDAHCAGDDDCADEQVWSFNPEDFSTGSHTISVQVQDGAGNVATQSWTVNVVRGTDPGDDEAQAQLRETAPEEILGDEATNGQERCAEVEDQPSDADVIVHGSWSGGTSSTEYFSGGIYTVSHCDASGKFVEAQEIGPVQTSSGAIVEFPLGITKPLDGPEEQFLETSFTYIPSDTPEQPSTELFAPDVSNGQRPSVPQPSPLQRSLLVDYRCEVNDAIRIEPYQDWEDDHPTFEINPSGHGLEADKRRKDFRYSQRLIDAHRVWNLTQDPCGYHNLDSWYAVRGTTQSRRPSTDHNDDHNVMQLITDEKYALPADRDGVGGCGDLDSTACSNNRYSRPRLGKNRLIHENDLMFKRSKNWYVGKYLSNCSGNKTDLWSLAVHEVGHMLGFDHNNYGWSVMSYSSFFEDPITGCFNGYRLLSKGEVLGMRRVYPKDD